jgi:hypothetical protein
METKKDITSLDEELMDYINHQPELGLTFIQHPYFSDTLSTEGDIVYTDVNGDSVEMNLEDQIYRINKSFWKKKECIEKIIQEGRLNHLLTGLIEKPYRYKFFLKYQDKLTDEEYWKSLVDIFISTERQSHQKEDWILSFNSKRPKRENLFVEEEDLDFFNQLPDKVEVWRGVDNEDFVMGLSWTTDEEQGEWFSQRLGSSGELQILCNGWIEKDKILMSSQHENLIVCNPKDITDLKTEIL